MTGDIVRSVIFFLKEEEGPTAVEYAVMLALIIVVCVVSISVIGGNTNTMYGNMTLKTATVTTTSS